MQSTKPRELSEPVQTITKNMSSGHFNGIKLLKTYKVILKEYRFQMQFNQQLFDADC